MYVYVYMYISVSIDRESMDCIGRQRCYDKPCMSSARKRRENKTNGKSEEKRGKKRAMNYTRSHT